MHVGQPPLDAIVVKGQFRVIDSKQVKKRRMKIMPWYRALHRFPPNFIRGPIGYPGLEPSARHPDTKTRTVVVSSRTHLV